jgi:hypothetical protein
MSGKRLINGCYMAQGTKNTVADKQKEAFKSKQHFCQHRRQIGGEGGWIKNCVYGSLW